MQVNKPKIIFDISVLAVTCILTFWGVYYLVYRILLLPKALANIIFFSTLLVTIPPIIYGYYKGYKRNYAISQKESALKERGIEVNKSVNIIVLSISSVVAAVLGIFFLYKRKYFIGVVFALAAALFSVFILKKSIAILRGKS